MKLELFNIMKNIIGDTECRLIGEIIRDIGHTAVQLANLLAPRVDSLMYYGYDLFDGDAPNRLLHQKERNAKSPPTIEMTKKSLDKVKRRLDNFEYKLFQGLTLDTLNKSIVFDFVYIDGGHSYDTVKHDYTMVKDSKIIVFDDCKIPGVYDNIQELISQGIDVEIVSTPSKHTWAVIRN